MNQILYTGGKKKDKDIKTIIKFLAIILIFFGILVASNASYKIYNNIQQGSQEYIEKPVINVEKINDNNIVISATHSKKIANIVYKWNEEEENVVEGNGTNLLSFELQLPTGTNTLKIIATDINGQSISYEKQYIAGSIPEIKLSVEGTKIKAVITSEEGLSYITYRWDEQEETKVDVNGEKTSELEIEIPEGLHTLTIISVDINNNTEIKEQEVKGVTKPNLDVSTDGEVFIIKATDKEKLQKIEYTINGETKTLEIDGTEYTFNIPLNTGDNKLIIAVYNSNGLKAERKCRYEK